MNDHLDTLSLLFSEPSDINESLMSSSSSASSTCISPRLQSLCDLFAPHYNNHERAYRMVSDLPFVDDDTMMLHKYSNVSHVDLSDSYLACSPPAPDRRCISNKAPAHVTQSFRIIKGRFEYRPPLEPMVVVVKTTPALKRKTGGDENDYENW